MSVTIAATLTVNRLPEIIAKFPEAADAICGKTAMDIVAEAQSLAPVDISDLKNSIVPERESVGHWLVRVDVEYGAAVEYGGKAHMPPVKAITPWAERHGIDPWALAISISRKGTKRQPFLTPAAEKMRPGFEMAFQRLEMML